MPTEPNPPFRCLNAQQLVELARQADLALTCRRCRAARSPGWESMPGSFDRSTLVQVGTLRDENEAEPTLQEHHPNGTHGWSPNAPIALGYFPYNRCSVWQCASCKRAYLQYTEYGGYYEDQRIRQVDPALVVDTGL